MKKIIVWIITLLFFVAFAFTAIKVNAEESNVEEETPTIEEVVEENETIVDVEPDTPVIDESTQEQPDNFEVENTPTTDDNTQEEVDKVPTIIENKTKEITDYVISLVVAFLGSSAFYAIVKAITSHGTRILKDKISELEKQNQISQKAKEIYEAKIADLENTLVDATEKIDVVLDQFTKYLELDAAKQKQAADLLEKLLPPVDNNDNKKEGE